MATFQQNFLTDSKMWVSFCFHLPQNSLLIPYKSVCVNMCIKCKSHPFVDEMKDKIEHIYPREYYSILKRRKPLSCMVAHTCNLSILEAETGGSLWAWGQPQLYTEQEFVLKQIEREKEVFVMTEDIVLTGTDWTRKSKCVILHLVPNKVKRKQKKSGG